MNDLPLEPDSNRDASDAASPTSPGTYPGTPRWVMVSGIVAIVIILLLIAAVFTGGGRHGPMRHMPSGAHSGHSGDTPIPAVSAIRP